MTQQQLIDRRLSGFPGSQRYEEGCSRGVQRPVQSLDGPSRLRSDPRRLPHWRPRREGSALSALDGEPRPPIRTGGYGANPARTLALSRSPSTGLYGRAPDRNGLRTLLMGAACSRDAPRHHPGLPRISQWTGLRRLSLSADRHHASADSQSQLPPHGEGESDRAQRDHGLSLLPHGEELQRAVTGRDRSSKATWTDDPHKLWHWEGNVQDKLVTWLEQEGWTIRSAADTAAKSAGKDIIACA